ncbi:Uncharacterised protein [Vibrio cholerae]|nr:Uncharacterised protein [Vibrio cholerae]
MNWVIKMIAIAASATINAFSRKTAECSCSSF